MVDVVMPSDENRGVFLLRRASDPHEGFSALPGGFAQLGERLEEAAVRIAEDEAGLRAEVIA